MIVRSLKIPAFGVTLLGLRMAPEHVLSMRVILSTTATAGQIARVVGLAGQSSSAPENVSIESRNGHLVVSFDAGPHSVDPVGFRSLPGVDAVEDAQPIYTLAALPADESDGRPRGRSIVGIPFVDARIGSDQFVVMAGPCAVENEDDLLATARKVRASGASLLRGGAFKPRTSPYSFQGVGGEGLEMLARVREKVGIGVVTEAMEPDAIEKVAEIADIIQIGSRNMHNYPLLKEAGRQAKPVLLKRGMSATLEEWLGAAEYVLSEGNPNVILCERGIRTFSAHSRHTLDIGVIPVIRERSRLPVIVDPSHATGAAERVPSMARAALAAGADGILVEVHPDPARALCDSRQALTFEIFDKLMTDLVGIAPVVGRRI